MWLRKKTVRLLTKHSLDQKFWSEGFGSLGYLLRSDNFAGRSLLISIGGFCVRRARRTDQNENELAPEVLHHLPLLFIRRFDDVFMNKTKTSLVIYLFNILTRDV
jgi:hypothetical protein